MPNIVDIVGTIAQNFNIGDATLSVDTNTKSLESSIGYGLKNSKYVSNAILSIKDFVSVSGLVVTLPADYEFLISNGRDGYNSTSNPNGRGGLKSTYVKTATSYSVTMTALGSGVSKKYDVFYNHTNTSLVAFESGRIIASNTQPSAVLYDVWRNEKGNLFSVSNGTTWTATQLIKVCSFTLNNETISSLVYSYPCDLTAIEDYIKQSIIGSLEWNRQEIAASANATSSINLNGVCTNVNNMIVLVEHTELPVSAYSLNSSGTVLTFTEAIPAGLRIDLRWL